MTGFHFTLSPWRISLCGGHGSAVAPRSCHVQNGEVRWASHCWGHSFQPSNKLKPQKPTLLQVQKSNCNMILFVFENSEIRGGYLVGTCWISWKKTLWGILENKMLTGVVGLPFSEMPPGDLMLWKHASKYTKKLWGFCEFGVLHLMNIPTKCESKWSSQNKADPPTSDTGASFNVYNLQSSVHVIFSSWFGPHESNSSTSTLRYYRLYTDRIGPQDERAKNHTLSSYISQWRASYWISCQIWQLLVILKMD